MSTNPFVRRNRELWDELTPIHARSESYDLEGFLAGRCSLKPLELREVGDVEGRDLLHLQCHFGQDTLSWARRGARVTGMDISPKAVELARRLAGELDLPARFVCCDLYELPDELQGDFDVVFTSVGVLTWLPDIRGWARVAAGFVRPGGFLYVLDEHPLMKIFADEDVDSLQVRHGYFHDPEPTRWEGDGSYADPHARVVHPSYEWTHPLGEIVTALLEAGLRIEFLHEHPFGYWKSLPFQVQEADGTWHLPAGFPALPHLFSVRAGRSLPT